LDDHVTRPSTPSPSSEAQPGAVGDDELTLEVDALINELGAGLDASSIEVEAVGPGGNSTKDEEPEDDGFIALDFEEAGGEAVDDVDVEAIWSKTRPIDPEVHEAELALVEAHA
jgi:hypothetical protein